MKRRSFIAATAFMSLAPGITTMATDSNNNSMVIHHVFFWLKQKGNEADKKLLMEGLHSLRNIQQVKKLFIGTPARTEQRSVVDSSYDVSELMYFDSAADQDAYQADPVHKAFVENYSHLWERVVVYDMLVSD